MHPATEGITTRTIRELVHAALERLPTIPDPLPPRASSSAESLSDYDQAIREIHFPEDPGQLARAQERLKFDELFTLELGVAFRKHRVEAEQAGVAHDGRGPADGAALPRRCPFEPTGAQERAIDGVDEAMARPRPMNVLLQGDVGAGKTLVALHAALVAIQSGHQAAIMAPTEVLAGQHLRSVAALLEGVGAVPFLRPGARVVEATTGRRSLLDPAPACAGATRPSRTRCSPARSPGRTGPRSLDGIADGSIDLSIGTHALVQEGVAFARPVARGDRRAAPVRPAPADGAEGQGREPDVLIMTATPIPRTLALTYYGDLDVVVLDEMPKGRQPIETRAVRTHRGRERRLRPGPRRGGGGPAGVRGLRGDRRGEPLAGEGGRGGGRAPGHRGVPRPARRPAPRPHAPEGEGGA